MGIRLSSDRGPENVPPTGQPSQPGLVYPQAGSHDYGGMFQKFLKFARWGTIALTFGYAAWVMFVIYMVEYKAEDHHLSSVFMYLPQYIWIFPLFVLGFLQLVLWQWKLFFIDIGVAAVVLFFFMDYVWAGPKEASGPTVTLVTNNIGEGHNTTINKFAETEQADIIALQDCNAQIRGPKYAEEFPDRYVGGYDQFLLISKFPIRNGGLLPMVDAENRPVASWFELDVNGRALYVFNLHMPTPRDQMNAVRGFGMFASVTARVKPGGHAEEVYKAGKEFFKKQYELAQQMVDVTKQADKPFIVCGDFNIPTHGKIYHFYKANWTEAFAEAGRGYGCTFPGDAKITKIAGPWMRLDNIYSGGGLKAVHAVAETGRNSQHLGMAAKFELPKN